jgi:acylphosphatase
MRHVTHVIVRGLVQGVSFRAWTVGQAERSGVDGWVRNREDGGLEAILAGVFDRPAQDRIAPARNNIVSISP